MTSSSCWGLRPPTMGKIYGLFCITQATAIAPSVAPFPTSLASSSHQGQSIPTPKPPVSLEDVSPKPKDPGTGGLSTSMSESINTSNHMPVDADYPLTTYSSRVNDSSPEFYAIFTTCFHWFYISVTGPETSTSRKSSRPNTIPIIINGSGASFMPTTETGSYGGSYQLVCFR